MGETSHNTNEVPLTNVASNYSEFCDVRAEKKGETAIMETNHGRRLAALRESLARGPGFVRALTD